MKMGIITPCSRVGFGYFQGSKTVNSGSETTDLLTTDLLTTDLLTNLRSAVYGANRDEAATGNQIGLWTYLALWIDHSFGRYVWVPALLDLDEFVEEPSGNGRISTTLAAGRSAVVKLHTGSIDPAHPGGGVGL
jgi:hypothetical protein